MQEGGDRGKAPNKTGTQPRKRTKSPQKNARRKTVAGASTAQKSGARKTPRGTGRRQREKAKK